MLGPLAIASGLLHLLRNHQAEDTEELSGESPVSQLIEQKGFCSCPASAGNGCEMPCICCSPLFFIKTFGVALPPLVLQHKFGIQTQPSAKPTKRKN